MANPLLPMSGPETPPVSPQGMSMPVSIGQGNAPPPQPLASADPKDVQAFHDHASTFFNTLTDLASRPQGQLTKDDLFKAVAGLMGKGLFSDPQSQTAMVTQLAQMPDDEGAIRQLIAREMMQTAHVQNEMRARFPPQEDQLA